MINQQAKTPIDTSNLLSYTGLERAFFPNRDQKVPQRIIQ